MRRLHALLLAGLCAATTVSGAVAAVSVADDTGQRITLPQPARRIVSLAPHATELLFEAGAGARVVAATDYSDWPPAARALPRVGGYHALDLEKIAALKPDLVVAWASGNPPAQLDRLRALGVPVFRSEPRQLEDVARTLDRLGVLAGTTGVAQPAASRFRARIATLRQRHAGAPPVRVFYQIWSEPLMTLNGDHIISEVIALCGGVNVFAGQPAMVPTVTEEAVLRAAPELIISPSEPGVPGGALDRWRKWPGLPATARGQLQGVDGDLLNRAGPRLTAGAEVMCAALDHARAQAPSRATLRRVE